METPQRSHSLNLVLLTLNIHEGMGAAMLDCIISAQAQSEGAKKPAEERKHKGETILENLKAAKNLRRGLGRQWSSLAERQEVLLHVQ